jgi:hypothetical protein
LEKVLYNNDLLKEEKVQVDARRMISPPNQTAGLARNIITGPNSKSNVIPLQKEGTIRRGVSL